MDQGLLAEFLAECGLATPFHVEVFSHDDATTHLVESSQPFLVIGQREGSDLRLDHWLVGRRHVYLQLIEGRFRCIDLGARTGTHGGVATDRAGWVDPDRPLKIGPYLVRPIIPAENRPEYPPLPIVTWSKVDRPENEPRWAMNRALALVGRSPFCEFRLADPNVSRFHCGLVVTARGVWVVDLLSQRSVLVNNQEVRFAPVRPGDILQVGPYRLTPHYDMSLIQAVQSRLTLTPGTTLIADVVADFPGESSSDFSEESLSGSTIEHLPVLTTPTMPAGFWQAAGPLPEMTNQLGANELMVTALVEQFGAMQQQMFDQFHQMMLGMFERFAELHRETSSSVRAEFDEVRKLSDEIESLRTETARLAEVSTLAMQQAAFERSARLPAPTPSAPPAPRLVPPATSPSSVTRPGAVPPAGPIPPPAAAAAAAQPTRQPLASPLPSATGPTGDIHAELCLRLNRMESERQGRLQKIWAMMMTSKT